MTTDFATEQLPFVTTYRLAALSGLVTLCAEHAAAPAYALGPVANPAHHGSCDECRNEEGTGCGQPGCTCPAHYR